MKKTLFLLNKKSNAFGSSKYSAMNNTILDKNIANCIQKFSSSPRVADSKEKFSLFGKKLIGRALEFEFGEKKELTTVNNNKIKKSVKRKHSQRICSNQSTLSFCPDFTSTPNVKVPKTSTPVKQYEVASYTRPSRTKCYLNSTFKEGINISLVFFGTKTNRYCEKLKKTSTEQVKLVKYYKATKQVTCTNLREYNFYYTEKKFEQLKYKLIKRNFKKSVKVKRLTSTNQNENYES